MSRDRDQSYLSLCVLVPELHEEILHRPRGHHGHVGEAVAADGGGHLQSNGPADRRDNEAWRVNKLNFHFSWNRNVFSF